MLHQSVGDPICKAYSLRFAASSRRPENAQLRPWDGKAPASVAGAVIYAICSLPTAAKHCSAMEIAQVEHPVSLPLASTGNGTGRQFQIPLCRVSSACRLSQTPL